jgi:hypothetical protein
MIPQRERTLPRFIMELGACMVPRFVLGKTPLRAWQLAMSGHRMWMRSHVYDKIGIKHVFTRAPCWCYDEVNATDRRRIFAAFLRFKKTGQITAPRKRKAKRSS